MSGLDEAYDFNFCPVCNAKVAGWSIKGLFADEIRCIGVYNVESSAARSFGIINSLFIRKYGVESFLFHFHHLECYKCETKITNPGAMNRFRQIVRAEAKKF